MEGIWGVGEVPIAGHNEKMVDHCFNSFWEKKRRVDVSRLAYSKVERDMGYSYRVWKGALRVGGRGVTLKYRASRFLWVPSGRVARGEVAGLWAYANGEGGLAVKAGD